jgi:hypothetical protein
MSPRLRAGAQYLRLPLPGWQRGLRRLVLPERPLLQRRRQLEPALPDRRLAIVMPARVPPTGRGILHRLTRPHCAHRLCGLARGWPANGVIVPLGAELPRANARAARRAEAREH